MTERGARKVNRRDVLKYVGAGVIGAGIAGVATYFGTTSFYSQVTAKETVTETVTKTVTKSAPAAVKTTTVVVPSYTTPKPGGGVPSGPVKIGWLCAYSGPAAVSAYSGDVTIDMVVEKINAGGGILGRKVQVIKREQGKAEDTVREVRKLALEDKVDYIMGIIASGNAEAAAPVAEELGIPLTISMARSSRIFAKKQYKFVFRTPQCDVLESVNGMIFILKQLGEKIKTWGYLMPDYAYGRDIWTITKEILKKLRPDIDIVYEGFPPLFTTDYTSYITKILAVKPDVLYTTLWGGDWITFVKQAKPYGLFDKIIVAAGAGQECHSAVGMECPEGIFAGVRYWFLWPPHELWPLNKEYVEEYHKRTGGWPYYWGESTWAAIMMWKSAIEIFYAENGRWPDFEEVCKTMEGMALACPGGIRYIRPEDHESLIDDVWGVTKYVEPDKFKVPLLNPIHIGNPEWCFNPPGIYAADWVKSWPDSIVKTLREYLGLI